ncbi:nitrogenase molybdenum-iron protein subunit beta [Magnetospirillum sp. ME-1]|uniref:nitrogenase molybdenum-iron protein subunit beta n=1 Tax=Magnetospirillum sp. ME-1 TaxID=1639348 RepID=UPI000A17A793|nr:nitrogenase molybdenum-iron protein subunit beta [Magnetospirillum sp. ME-1]ARJ65721.1 nitrogenase molybdenum-iron protein subunit beta [Magnetospirillum sp. ME-1]
MPQSAEKTKDHVSLFQEPEYTEMFAAKKAQFECRPTDEAVAAQAEYTKTWEYREKNFAREKAVINPAKACQPLGAVFAAQGFEETMPYVHGSQGCVAYFRSHLARHFKEAVPCVSDSMTEDAAVFGGLTNIVDGLQNSYTLYKPKMIAVSTTCMAEVIGDDLSAFIATAKEKESVPADFAVPFAHTPSFVGSHTTGYDNMIKGVLSYFWDRESEKTRGKVTEKINIIPGFDGYAVANNRELKRYLDTMGVEYTFISDVSDIYDTPSDGTYRMYDGGTKLDDVRTAIDAKATIALQHDCSAKSLEYIETKGQPTANFRYPMGVSGTDALLMKISELSGKPIPESIEKERGRLVDAMTDSQAYLHGKKVAVFGDPDFVYGMVSFLLEMGCEPLHCLSTNGGKEWVAAMEALLASSPFGAGCKVYAGKDLWHMRSLLFTEPTDLLIGSSYGKYLEKDTGIPLIRLTFPIFDRHHHHRFPTLGYQGALRVLVEILDRIFEVTDASSDISYDLTR